MYSTRTIVKTATAANTKLIIATLALALSGGLAAFATLPISGNQSKQGIPAGVVQIKNSNQATTTLEGTYEHWQTDGPANSKEFRKEFFKNYYFIKTKTEKIKLNFKSKQSNIPMNIPNGSTIKITGLKQNNQIEVEQRNFSMIKSASPFRAIIKNKKKSMLNNIPEVSADSATPFKVAVILYNFNDSAAFPYTPEAIEYLTNSYGYRPANLSEPFTQEWVRHKIFTDVDSVKAYYNDASFGKIILEGAGRPDGDVYGWYTVPFSSANCGEAVIENGRIDDVLAAARRAAQSNGFDESQYDYVVYIHPWIDCGYAGISGDHNAIINGMVTGQGTVAHEMGHGFGLSHAKAYYCQDQGGNRVSLSDNCREYEYGDYYDVMGQSWGLGHFNTFEKDRLQWYGQNNILTVDQSGTYTLTPIEQSSRGLQAIYIVKEKFSDGSPRSYYAIEYRQPIGFDRQVSSPLEVSYGVQVRLIYTDTFSGLITKWSRLLDMTPQTTDSSNLDHALPVGQTFQDPDGFKIKTVSAGPNEAQVEITTHNVSTPPNPKLTIRPKTASAGDNQIIPLAGGTITSNPAGINCGVQCSADFPALAPIELEVTTNNDFRCESVTSNISLNCQPGNNPNSQICPVQLVDKDENIYIVFRPTKLYSLSVSSEGEGSGSINISGTNYNTPWSPLLRRLWVGTAPVLTAAPSADSVFDGWFGECSGRGSCQLSMTQNRDVRARFSLKTCADTDGGIDYANKGTVTKRNSGESLTDVCVLGKELWEYSCKEDGNFNITTTTCPAVCDDGACKEAAAAPVLTFGNINFNNAEQSVNYELEVINNGTETVAPPFYVSFSTIKANGDSVPIVSGEITSGEYAQENLSGGKVGVIINKNITARNSVTISGSIPKYIINRGATALSVSLDAQNSIAESNEENNIAPPFSFGDKLVDYVITNVGFNTSTSTHQIIVEITNRGSAAGTQIEGGINLKWKDASKNIMRVQSMTLRALPAGSVESYTIDYPSGEDPLSLYFVDVNAAYGAGLTGLEADLSSNTRQDIPIPR